MKKLITSIVFITIGTTMYAQDVAGQSPWGKLDEIGTLNMMTDNSRAKVFESIKSGKTYDLGENYFVGMPGFTMMGDPNYQYWLTHTPNGTIIDNPNWQGETINKKVSYSSDAISMFTHTGTHIDALSHFGLYNKLWNGYDASKYLGDKGWKKCGAEKIPPIIARGVLIDVAAYKGLQVLDTNYRITVEDLKGAIKKQKTELDSGDVVLIRTGQAKYYGDANKYVTKFPGLSFDAAKWLVEEKKIMLMGADNLGLEAFPSEKPDNWVPLHTYLLAQKGMMFIEQLNLEELSKDKQYVFGFFAASLKLQGATGAPTRPFVVPYGNK